MYELMVEDTFDAAHALRGYEGSCENLHGHTWKVQVFLKGNKLNKIGLFEDFRNIKQRLRTTLNAFDHKLINDIPPFDKKNPTSENLAETIYKLMKKSFKSLTKVTIWESPTTNATYS
ncbi:MAG: 6-carboxytetrahydropterin synthase QueD [Candidatus Margulisbacteria bacterium]|nr:6-carboxytetrahydropterin synthase QueD [Candidatus Margulisiibacteriota bacterium]